MLVFASICPHPPIIIPTIGRPSDLKKVEKTIEGMQRLAGIFADTNPQTILIISPHAPFDLKAFSIINSPVLAGHFYNFGDFKTELLFKNDRGIVKLITDEAEKDKIPLRVLDSKELDHGVLVPIFYLYQKLPKIKIIPLAYSYLNLETHFKFGEMLQRIISKKGKTKFGIIASGDLSHRLTPDAPAGCSIRGKEFDDLLIDLLREKDIKGILNMEPDLVEEAGECGYRSIVILLGALQGLNWRPEILSYEGPFGVGYLTMNFKL